MNAGLANNIAQGQAQRDVGVDDRANQQRPTTEIDRHGRPVPEVSGPPEATSPLAIEGPPLQARHQRRLRPPSGTFSSPTIVISDTAFEEWLQSDQMEMSMFSQSEGPQQSAPTAVTLAAAAPAAEAMTGTRVFPAVSPMGVAEAPASSADAASAKISAAEPTTSGTVPSAASIRGAVEARELSTGAVSSDAATEAAPSTGGTATPAASTAREARALASAAGSDGEISGDRGASTHPFDPGTVCPLEVHYYNDSWLQYGSSSGSSSSSNDNTSDHDSWWDASCVGVLLRSFDPPKLCRRSTRREKAVLGVDLTFDRGKAWGQIQHGG